MFPFQFSIDEIKPNEVFQKLNQGQDLFMLDVREPDEFAQIRIDNTVLIPRGVLETGSAGAAQYQEELQILQNSKSKEVIVICRSGVRSLHAAKYLKDSGFGNVKSMQTGVVGWAQSGLPVSGNILQNA